MRGIASVSSAFSSCECQKKVWFQALTVLSMLVSVGCGGSTAPSSTASTDMPFSSAATELAQPGESSVSDPEPVTQGGAVVSAPVATAPVVIDSGGPGSGGFVPDNSSPEHSVPDPGSTAADGSYCAQFAGEVTSYFCEDFTGTSPPGMVGLIPPMSFRDQTYREYSKGELFALPDPDADALTQNVVNLHTDLIDGNDFSEFARVTRNASTKWDITAHSRDGYVQPGTGSGFDDEFWWNENVFMGEHGKRCGRPPDLSRFTADSGERAYTFMQQFFAIPESYNGEEKSPGSFWAAEYENQLTDSAGLHPIIRYEDMVYLCADHLMTAAYAEGAAKVSITPGHLLDLSAGHGVVEFSVSTYRTAGRDYWQLDLTPLASHLQLPEGDVAADANGKAVNGFNINTELNDSMAGPADLLGGINVFRTLMMKDGQFLENGEPIAVTDPAAVYTRAEITNPGNAGRLQLYANAPEGEDWVITHTSYNQVMYDFLAGGSNPAITLHNVTDNRSRVSFRLSVRKTPTLPVWAADADRWDQVSLCMPDYSNGCVGEYIVPELDDELLVQFTHYAYNTTKSCDQSGIQPHGVPGAAFQSTCHPNTYHWDNFYISPSLPFTVTKSISRTATADSSRGQVVELEFDNPSPPNSKLRFNALTGGSANDANGKTTLEVSFDDGVTWSVPSMQFEPENNFDKFRSYFTGGSDNTQHIPAGVSRVLFRAENASYRGAFWIRDASFWSVPDPGA